MHSNTLPKNKSRGSTMSSLSTPCLPKNTMSTRTSTRSTPSCNLSLPTVSWPSKLALPPPSSTHAPTRASTANASSSSTTLNPTPTFPPSTFTRRHTADTGNPFPSSWHVATVRAVSSGIPRRTRWTIRCTNALVGPSQASRVWSTLTVRRSDRSMRLPVRGRVSTVIASRNRSNVPTAVLIWIRNCSNTFPMMRRRVRLKSAPRSLMMVKRMARPSTPRWIFLRGRTSCPPTSRHRSKFRTIAWRTSAGIPLRNLKAWAGPLSLKILSSLLIPMAIRRCRPGAERTSSKLVDRS
mmetsp:Transcript_28447/g.60613  ORF Transcript_28447/g.60613 Transcript_28447/m.60613 type:complete len:295 (+) Transcript_28447:1834-2718(+)